jgi:hypothetical protein
VNGFDAFTGIILQNSEQHERKINWLKSLRPQPCWKPSDEQMRVLEDVITMKRGNEYETTMLRTLYDDLKKL